MAYMDFSTKRADYLFEVVNRGYVRRDIRKFDGIDALVIECGLHPLEEVNRRRLAGVHDVIDYCATINKPVYSVDPDNTILGVVRGFPGIYLTLPVVPLELYYGFSKGRVHKLSEKIIADYLYTLQCPLIAARNAISAKKIEEYVVERVKDESNIIKPRIGIVYMSGHIGLKKCILSKKRREFTINHYKKWNFSPFSGLKKHTLNTIVRAEFNGSRWDIEHIDTDLIN